jgi:hypothetical protein
MDLLFMSHSDHLDVFSDLRMVLLRLSGVGLFHGENHPLEVRHWSEPGATGCILREWRTATTFKHLGQLARARAQPRGDPDVPIDVDPTEILPEPVPTRFNGNLADVNVLATTLVGVAASQIQFDWLNHIATAERRARGTATKQDLCSRYGEDDAELLDVHAT